MKKKIAVIGAGPGGLTASMLLSAKGFDVEVFEKQSYIGGRTSSIHLGDYTFDMGPTFLQMFYLIEEIFELSNRNVHDYIDVTNLNPMYQLIFNDKKIVMTQDREQMIKQMSELFPGNEHGYDKFMEQTGKKLEKLGPALQSEMNRFVDLLQPKILKALPELEFGRSLIDILSTFFNDQDLQLAFTFQAKYLGMSPWESPGAFSILSYIEHAYGVQYIKGGLNQLTKAMAQIVNEYGGKIHTDCGVKKLWLDGRKVKGVILENGEKVAADDVVVNADFAHAMTTLVDPGVLKKYSPKKLEKKPYSCSTIVLYLGVKKTFDLPHHSIIFSSDYKRNVEEISKTKILSEDPSIYVLNAAATDPSVAPAGKSALYIMAPVPNNFSGINWEQEQARFRKLILNIVQEKLGIEDLEPLIEEEKIISPKNWEEDIHVYKGATFNLGHQLHQMLYFRPHNKFEELDNCWLVGGGTHPGSGLPIIVESARITSSGILTKYNQDKLPAKSLPTSHYEKEKQKRQSNGAFKQGAWNN